MKDLDDLLAEFTKEHSFDSKKYQKYIYDFIDFHNNKTIIFVGLNLDRETDTLYDVRANYKFYIDLPIDTILKRHFDREINGWLDWMKNRDKNILFDQLTEDQNQVIDDLTKGLAKVLNISYQKKFILSFDNIYKNDRYIFLDNDAIYDQISELLE